MWQNEAQLAKMVGQGSCTVFEMGSRVAKIERGRCDHSWHRLLSVTHCRKDLYLEQRRCIVEDTTAMKYNARDDIHFCIPQLHRLISLPEKQEATNWIH